MYTSNQRPRTIHTATPLSFKPVAIEATSSASMISTTKPSVSFSKTVQVRFSPCLEEYANSEFEACWYSSEEYQAIEKSMCRQFMKMEQGKTLNDKKSCSRGLERYLTVNAIAKQENQRSAWQSVFDEQTRQTKLNQYDEEAIARVYRNVSSSCHMWAAVLGLRDQREATKYIQDDDDVCYDFESLITLSQESQESSVREDCVVPQKSYDAYRMRQMTSPQQVAVSARTA